MSRIAIVLYYWPVLRFVALWLALAAPEGADLYNQGARLYSQQQFEEAEHVLRQAVRKNPQSASARFLLGATLLQLRRNPEAVQELRAANQLNPGNVDTAKLLATEYVASHQFAAAIQVLRALAPSGPADEETFLLLIQATRSAVILATPRAPCALQTKPWRSIHGPND